MPATGELPATGLRRVLKLRDLIYYGIVLITPTAPVGIFGVASKMSHGHVATTLVAAMLAMLLTAYSYGRMAALYPSAGSAYTYVSRGLDARLGFVAGWAMSLDYLIIPVINTIYLSLTLERLAPQVPYAAWAAAAAAGMTVLNVRGIRFTARADQALLAVMSVVIAAFLVLAARFVVGASGVAGLLSARPFYNPATFDLAAVSTATSLAALTYIGFDGVTTLAEEAENPRRNILVATVLTCFITGVLSTVEVYLAQLAWPDYGSFPKPETAFLDVAGRVGGGLLFQAMGAVLALASLGSGLTGQVGAARLLYGMGRDGVLPRRLFGYLSPKTASPTYNLCLTGLLAFAGALVLPYELAAEILNFGAFLAFMGVNLATVKSCYARAGERRRLADAVLPALGFLFCLVIWASLPVPAKLVGGAWLLLGVTYHLAMRRAARA
jgi:amino acid transporter